MLISVVENFVLLSTIFALVSFAAGFCSDSPVIISITASLFVALAVTPVLCYYLLGHSKLLHDEGDSSLVAWLKRRYATILNWTLRHPYKIIGGSAVMLLIAVLLFPFMGREFLPPFNEGALNINASLPPGSSLQESNRMGRSSKQQYTKFPK